MCMLEMGLTWSGFKETLKLPNESKIQKPLYIYN